MPYKNKEDKAANQRRLYLSGYYNRPDVKEHRRNKELLRVYGITWDDKVRMYQEQKGLCGFCGEPLPAEISKAHVDHNHTTGEVRKLLHKQCNSVIAVFEKAPKLLGVVKTYLGI